MNKTPKKKGIIRKTLTVIGSAALSILSIPAVRDWIWDKIMKKGKEKIIEAEGKVVEEEK